MKWLKKAAIASAVATLGLVSAPAAEAIATKVQVSTIGGGDGTYERTGIVEFDWLSWGSLVIKDALSSPATASGGLFPGQTPGSYSSLAQWAANAGIGDTVTFNIYAQAQLTSFVGGGGTGAGNLSDNGSTCVGPGTCFEITTVLSGVESATLTAAGILTFTSISGTYQYWYGAPNADIINGTGFADGAKILEGDLVSISGSYCNLSLGCAISGQTEDGGSSLVTNSVTWYDTNYLETDPTSNAPLTGSTFDTLISLAGPLQDIIVVGGTIGVNAPPQYTVLQGDLILAADANTEFSATPAPEPSTALLLGASLLGMGLGLRRKSRQAAK